MHAVDDAEDGGVGADAERQRENHDDVKPGWRRERSQGVARGPCEVVHGGLGVAPVGRDQPRKWTRSRTDPVGRSAHLARRDRIDDHVTHDPHPAWPSRAALATAVAPPQSSQAPQAAPFDVLIVNGAPPRRIRQSVDARGYRHSRRPHRRPSGALAGSTAAGHRRRRSHRGARLHRRALACARGLTRAELRDGRALLAQGVTTRRRQPRWRRRRPISSDRPRRSKRMAGIGVNAALLIGHGSVRSAVVNGQRSARPTAEELEKMKALVRQASRRRRVRAFERPVLHARTVREDRRGHRARPRSRRRLHEPHPRRRQLRRRRRRVRRRGDSRRRRSEGARRRVAHESARARQLGPEQDDGGAHRGRAGARCGGVRRSVSVRGVVHEPRRGGDAGRRQRGRAGGDERRRVAPAVPGDGEGEHPPARRAGVHRHRIGPRRGKLRPARVSRRSRRRAAFRRSRPPPTSCIAGGASIVSFNMSEDDIETIMRQPWTMGSSDGGLSMPGAGQPHPRNNGAFARRLARYVRERQT